MKNTVDEMIKSFSREEFREFKYFLTRHKGSGNEREDLKVVHLIRNETTFHPDNVEAYRKTKNRLKKQLEHFIELENLRNDSSSQVHNYIEIAKYLFRKNLYDHAWDYLIKAEQIAVSLEEYELLNYIYYIQLSYSFDVAIAPSVRHSIPTLLEKRKHNLSFAKTDGNANAAYAHLIYEIRDRLSKRLNTDIDSLVSRVLTQYGLNDVLYHDKPRIYCKIVNIVCQALREKLDYEKLRRYAINSFNVIKNKRMLDKIPLNYLLNLLDMICIAAIRSKDYRNYEKFLAYYNLYAQKLQLNMDEYSYYDFIRYVDYSDLYMCTNRLDESRKSLLTAYHKYAGYDKSIRISFLLRVNLIAVNFCHQEYQSCIGLFHEIMNMNEKKILSERGFRLEILLYTELYGAIFYYENDDIDYAHYLLSKAKRKYSKVLKDAHSQRENMFIKIFERMLSNPSYISGKKFVSDCEKFVKMKALIPGDLFEYISLNAWLTSKHNVKSYYECFLELVN